MSYSEDFKELVVRKLESGMTWDEALSFFSISRDTLGRWVRYFREHGHCNMPTTRISTPRKIDPDKLTAAIKRRPDATLSELALEFNCWPQSIHKRCQALGITRKKNQPIHRER